MAFVGSRWKTIQIYTNEQGEKIAIQQKYEVKTAVKGGGAMPRDEHRTIRLNN